MADTLPPPPVLQPPPPAAAPPAVPLPADARTVAIQRLCASRARLYEHLCPPPPASAAAQRGPASAVRGLWRRWRRELAHAPLALIAGDALSSWWQRQPWRVLGDAAVLEVRRSVSPWVRRHPALAVALAAGVGAALVGGRPLQWPWLGPHLRPLPQRLGRWALQQLASVPVQALLTTWALSRSLPSEDDAAPVAQPAEAEAAPMR